MKTKNKRGFSLVELMVTMAVSSVIILVLFSLLNQVTKTWNQTRRLMEGRSQGQVLLNLIARDIESSISNELAASRRQGEWIYLKQNGTNPRDSELYLVTMASDRDQSQPGDLCSVAFRLSNNDPFGGSTPIYSLYRTLAEADDTYNNLLVSGILEDFWAAKNTTMNGNILASNILNFHVALKIRAADGTDTVHNSGTIIMKSNSININGVEEPKSQIIAAEIFATFVSDEAASQIRSGGLSVENAVTQYGQTFSKTIQIN